MGREWLHKARGGGHRSSTGEKSPASATTATKQKAKKEKNNTFSGCMSAVFSVFDIQRHQFRLHHPAFISESTINLSSRTNIDLRGVEAPRNSLESPESSIVDVARSSSSSSKAKEETNLNIPMGGIKIKTQRSRFTDDISSECSSSPGTKTPNLVARLMGLDILPEYTSPRPSADATPVMNSHNRSRSLPSTPRLSATSRRSADNDYHHRLSLQVDKENFNNEQKSRYAKEIANQVRERINRRLGTDITNTISSTRNKEYRRDSNLVLLKPKKPLAPLSPVHSFAQETVSKAKQDIKNPKLVPLKPKKPPTSPLAQAQYSAPQTTKATKTNHDLAQFMSSPKLRLLDMNNNLTKPISHSQSLSYKDAAPKPKPMPPLRKSPIMKVEKPVKDQKMIRMASERYDSRLKKMYQQEEPYVGKISKKKSTLLPLPNHPHVSVNNTTKFHSFRKEMTSSYSATRLPQNQVSLMTKTQSPSNLNSSYNANPTHTFNFLNKPSFASKTGPFHDHFDYISKILDQCGISHTTLITAGQWHSRSHPLQPLIFHKLEKHYSSSGTSRRKMVFDLVDEFLVEMLKPYMNIKRPPDSFIMLGSELNTNLCGKICGFHAVKCNELEDINGLIDRDIGRSTQSMLLATIENEVDSIVKDIESDIVETLVHEMTSLVML